MTVLAAYNFDQAGEVEGAGVGNCIDEVGNHDGDVVGTVALSAGPISGKKRNYTGTDGNYISVPTHADFSMTVNKTFEMWTSFDDVSDDNHRYILTKGGAGGGNWQFFMALQSSTFKIQWYMNDTGSQNLSVVADVVPTLKTPHYICYTWNATSKTVEIFYDGLFMATGTNASINTSLLDNSENMAIGGYFSGGGGNFIFIGDHHAIRVSNTIMTQKEILDTYNGSDIQETS